VPIVEGPGDVKAIPVLLRKILWDYLNCYYIGVGFPKNAGGRGGLDKTGGIERFITYASITPDCEAILVLVDSDEDCALDWVKWACDRCRAIGLSVPIAVVCAVREYEAWFLASLDSIRGTGKLADDIQFLGNPESTGGAKEWFTQQMPPGSAYKETSDQASYSSQIDVPLAMNNSRSFKRLCHAVEELQSAMDSGSSGITPF
jgi:hypothetical protein